MFITIDGCEYLGSVHIPDTDVKFSSFEAPCCRVSPPTRLSQRLVLAATATRIATLVIPIALEKGIEATIVLNIIARNAGVHGRLARYKTALGLVAQHRDKLGAIIGLGA
jgi:hypothetical protein